MPLNRDNISKIMYKSVINKVRKYLAENLVRYKILILLSAVFFFLFSTIGFYKSSTRVYSGTTFSILPTKFYITKSFTAENILPGLNKKIDTIGTGSFLKAVNGKEISVPEEVFNILESIEEDSVINLEIININKIYSSTYPYKNYVNGYPIDSYIIKKSDIPDNFIKYLPKGIFIRSVEFNGATHNAGIKKGDVLVSVKNKAFKMKENSTSELSTESRRFLRSHKGGEVIPFKVLRNNNLITFDVRLATLGIDVVGLLSYLCGLLFLFTGLFYALIKPRIFAARITGITFMVISLLFTYADGFNSSSLDYISRILAILSYISSFMVFPLFFHNLAHFPKEHTELLKRKWTIVIPYCVSISASLLFLGTYFYDFDLFYETVFPLLPIINIINIIFYSSVRLWLTRKTSDEYRKVTRITRLTLSVFILSDIIVVLVQAFTQSNFPVILKYSFLLSIFIPASYIFTTWRYRLLDIDFRMKMNVKYNLISFILNTFIFFVFSGVLFLLSLIHVNFPNLKFTGDTIEYLAHPLSPELNTLYEKILIMILILLFAYIYLRVIKQVRETLDRKFYRQKFDYKHAQSELIKLFETKKEINSLAKSILEQLSELVHLKMLGITFFNRSVNDAGKELFFFNRLSSEHSKPVLPGSIFDEIDRFNSAFNVEYLSIENKTSVALHKFTKIIPIRTNGKLISALFIGEKLAETSLNDFDIEFLISISRNISVAIENAFLYEELSEQERIKQELAIARRIQLSSLPQTVPQIEGLQISATSIPAYEVGGDFYDFLNGTPDDVTVIIGDVSGKGTSAALYMSKVQGIFQTLHEFYSTPSEMLNKANKMIFRNFESNSFITAISANINAEKKLLSFSRAGHLPLFHFNSVSKCVEKITPKGIGLGLCRDEIFKNSLEEKSINFSSGDVFLFFSDGITESKNKSGEQFGEEKLERLLIKNNHHSSEDICEKIISEVSSFSQETKQFDDITLVVVKCV